MKRKYLSTFTLSIIFCLLAACIVLYPRAAFNAALDGLLLWFNVVCPALLPFFICVEILIGLGIVSFFGSAFKPLMRPVFNVPGEGSFGFFMSISSGYPVGARITAKLRQERLCTRTEGQRLLGLCSTSGPLFIIGAVATGILNNPAIGFFLAFSHYLSAITIGLLMRLYGEEKLPASENYFSNPFSDMLEYRQKDGRSMGRLMGEAVTNGVNLILMIGGFIIFFSVVTGMLKISGALELFSLLLSKALPFKAATPDVMSGLLIGFLEVTNGAKACAALQVPLIYKIIMVSFMIGFGGLSINAQVMSIISETDLKFGIYFVYKLLQGIIAAFYSFILFTLFSDVQVFNFFGAAKLPDGLSEYNRLVVLGNSALYLLLILAFMVLSAIVRTKKRLFPSKPFRMD